VLIDDPDQLPEAVTAFKAKGYRFLGREPLFALDIPQRTIFLDHPVRRVTTIDDAAAIAKAARSKQILPDHLNTDDSACRLFAAFHEQTPIGWVRSIRTHDNCAWVSNMFVNPDYRRRGIGRSLLSAMLEDDLRLGVQWSVLLASLTGALLYPRIGYVQQGLLLIFSPIRKTRVGI